MDVFRRKELKFILDSRQRERVEQELAKRMVPDQYGRSTVCSLYYDTDDFRLIRHSLAKPVYKEKLRLRSYGQLAPEGKAFLEMKKKFKGIVYKRRVKVTQSQAFDFMQRQAALPRDGQIARELLYFRDFYPKLTPKVCICYERLAWADPDGKGFRVTVDWDIRYRTDHLDLTMPTEGERLLPGELSLLEVKAAGGIPLWMMELLSREGIRKQSFSKYGRVYQKLLRDKLVESRGHSHA